MSKVSTGLAAARAAKSKAAMMFATFAPVAGIGITRIGDVYGLKVNLQRQPHAGVPLPTTIDGVPIRVEIIGLVHKQ